MCINLREYVIAVLVTLIAHVSISKGFYSYGKKPFDCGPYGFICEGTTRLRLCEGGNLYGPSFLCPANTFCNEDSSDVCEDAVNHIEPSLRGILRCHHNERLADPTVANCRGYILCVPIKNQYQAIKFRCTGNTIFNGYTHTCSAPEKYKCPLNDWVAQNVTSVTNRRSDVTPSTFYDNAPYSHRSRPIDCKNYKFSVRQDNETPARVAYFCPKRLAPGHRSIRCTIFSNHFCLTLQRDDEEEFRMASARRKPRMRNFIP